MKARVFRLRNNVNDYQSFIIEPASEWRRLHMDGTPKASEWVPPSVTLVNDFHKAGSFYQSGNDHLITSPHATEILRPFLEIAGELLPLPYGGKTYTVLNVTPCTDCLNRRKTEWVYGVTTGKVIGVQKYVFRKSKLPRSPLFKIPDWPTPVLVVERPDDPPELNFKYVVETKLEGLMFELLWESG